MEVTVLIPGGVSAPVCVTEGHLTVSAASFCCQEAVGLCTQTGESGKGPHEGGRGSRGAWCPGAFHPEAQGPATGAGLYGNHGEKGLGRGDLSGLTVLPSVQPPGTGPCTCGGDQPLCLPSGQGFLLSGNRWLRVYGNGGSRRRGRRKALRWPRRLRDAG